MLEDTQANCLCTTQPKLCGREGHQAGFVPCPDQPVNLPLWFLTAVAKESGLPHRPAPSVQGSLPAFLLSLTQALLQARQRARSNSSTPWEAEGSSMRSRHRVDHTFTNTGISLGDRKRRAQEEARGGRKADPPPPPRPSLRAGAVAHDSGGGKGACLPCSSCACRCPLRQCHTAARVTT